MRAHNARHRALIGNCQRFVAKCSSRFDEFLGMGCAAQERKITERMELGVTHGG